MLESDFGQPYNDRSPIGIFENGIYKEVKDVQYANDLEGKIVLEFKTYKTSDEDDLNDN